MIQLRWSWNFQRQMFMKQQGRGVEAEMKGEIGEFIDPTYLELDQSDLNCFSCLQPFGWNAATPGAQSDNAAYYGAVCVEVAKPAHGCPYCRWIVSGVPGS